MKNTLAVAVREIAERRAVLIAAAVGGLLPFASPLLPSVGAGRAAETRDAMALGIALAFGGATALAMGATVVARDLSEGRMTFDFARPISWRAIWGGRFLGAIALTVFVTAAVLLPSAIVGPLFPSLAGTGVPAFLAVWLVAVLSLVPIAHAASIAIRSKSRWLALDLVCGVVVVLIAAWVARQLAAAMAMQALMIASAVLGPLVILSLWIASATQVAVGRTDLVRGHKALSITAWSGIAGLTVILLGYSGWLLAASPADFDEIWAMPASRGSWSVIAGKTSGRGDYAPAMLLDSATGHYVRIGPSALVEPYFSPDGKRAIVLRPIDFVRFSGAPEGRYEITVADLTEAGATLRETSLTTGSRWPALAVSEEGRRIALLSEGILSVYEVDGGKTLASVRLAHPPDARGRYGLVFAGPDRVRFYTFQPEFEIEELDLASKRVEVTGEATLAMDYPRIQLLSGDRIFVHDIRFQERALLLDGRTGSILREYRAGPGVKGKFRRLEDGRVIVVDAAGAGRSVRVLSDDGTQLRAAPLEDPGIVVVGGEVAPGKLVISTAKRALESPEPSEWRLLLLDADSGEIRESAKGLVPVLSDNWGFPVSGSPVPGEAATHLFRQSHALVFYDPLTGVTRTVAGRGPA